MTKTRTQRRLEKRQAIILLIMVLGVSLASFTLGVVVGRHGAERKLAEQMRQPERVLMAETPQPATKAAEPAVPPVEELTDKPAGNSVNETRLSFYEDLEKDKAPLGSGINRPRKEEPPAAEPPVDLPEKPIVAVQELASGDQPTADTAKPAPPAAAPKSNPPAAAELPVVDPQGSHVVQVGAFNSVGDAVAFKDKLSKQDYPVFVVEADLGDKGLWYRVRVGPYAEVAQAKTARDLLAEKEKIKGFVTRK